MSSNTTPEQASLSEYEPATTTETVTRTLVVPLQSSQKKREKVRTAISEYQEMTSRLADLLVSFPPHERQTKNPSVYRSLRREFPKDEVTVSSRVMNSAMRDVVGAFQSWRELGMDGDRPQFKDCEYFAVTNQELTLESNDRGYGLRVKFIPYDAQWFHLKTREYHDDLLNRVTDGDARLGGSEIHLDDDGLRAYLPIRYDIEVYEPTDVTTSVGVDIGESMIYTAVVVSGDEIHSVEMKSGAEFRHHRERLDEKRRRLSQKGDLAGVNACRGERKRYTEQVCHTASKEIVRLASEHAPAVINLEDLTHYRETAKDPIHDWPFAQLQEKIAYKARDAGIPVTTIDPRNTSATCRKCGQTTPEYRNGDDWHCRRCGYQVHADVNAAINIAHGGVSD